MKLTVAGGYITTFGELWDKSLTDLAYEAVFGALKNAQIDPADVDAVVVANMAATQFDGQAHLGALVSGMFPHYPTALRVEAACASGGVALLQAELGLLSGLYKTVVVVGVEKMTDKAAEVTEILSSAANIDTEFGSTFPGLYALLAQAHMQQFGTTREALSTVASKNHNHALSNPKAQFRKAISVTAVEKSPMVADPLHMLDCSPVSDGAAAVVLTTKKHTSKVFVTGFGQGQDSLDLAGRASLTQLAATKKAAQLAFAQAGILPANITVAEVHDCFTIAELFAIEDLGLFPKGTSGEATVQGKTTFGGQLVVNHSGGLKACGHPVGATGVKQVAYLWELLTKGEYQNGLAHNVGGSGATAVVHILENKS